MLWILLAFHVAAHARGWRPGRMSRPAPAGAGAPDRSTAPSHVSRSPGQNQAFARSSANHRRIIGESSLAVWNNSLRRRRLARSISSRSSLAVQNNSLHYISHIRSRTIDNITLRKVPVRLYYLCSNLVSWPAGAGLILSYTVVNPKVECLNAKRLLRSTAAIMCSWSKCWGVKNDVWYYFHSRCLAGRNA